MTINKNFSKNCTLMVKGIAILSMLFHHTYPNRCYIPFWEVENLTLLTLLGSTLKICVSLFAIVSGYGIYSSYKTYSKDTKVFDFKFSLKHHIKILLIYWPIWLIKPIYSIVIKHANPFVFYGVGIKGIIKMLIDLAGLNSLFKLPSMVTDWYLSSCIVMYYFAPSIIGLVDKGFGKLLVLLYYLFWIFYTVFVDPVLDSWIFYLLPFILGIELNHNNIFEKINFFSNKIFLALIIFLLMLRQIFNLLIDPWLSLSLIFLIYKFLHENSNFGNLLIFIGTHSANIWFLHHIFGGVVMESYIVKFVFLTMISLLASIIIEKIKMIIKYEKINKLVVSFIDKI